MFSNNPVSQSMIDAVNKVLGEAPQAAAPAQPVEQPKNPFAPQLLDESDEKVNPEESKCVTEPKAKEIAKKEVKGHEKKLHQKEDMTFANKLKCSIKEGKATGTEEIFTDNNLGEEEMSDKQKAKREKIVMSMKGDEAGLKQRYGKNWKNVMYATATKQAMKEEVEDLEELDKSTLGSYVNKAAKNVASKAYKSGKAVDPKTGHNKDSWSNYDQAKKRLSGIDKAVSKLSKEEVEQVEEATPPKNTDIADKSYLKHKPGTVKGTMTQLGRFLRGKPEIKEDVEVQIDKSVDKITTDMLSGRVSGGKLNSFRNYKVDLKTSGEEPVPVECDKGTDTKEKQKISTNPGPVDIKLDDNLTTSPQSHFSDDKQIKNEEVKPELKHIRNKEGKMRDQEVTDFANKHTPGGLVKSNEELELEEKVIAGTDGWEKSPKNVKDKSGAVHTPMSRAKDLARQSFKKIKSDLGKNK